MRSHHDQVGLGLPGDFEDFLGGQSALGAVLDQNRPVWDIGLAQTALDRLTAGFSRVGADVTDRLLSEVHRLFGHAKRLQNVQDENPGVALAGKRTGDPKGVPRRFREVGGEQDLFEKWHDLLLTVMLADRLRWSRSSKPAFLIREDLLLHAIS